jgi:hypothetical protein
MRHFACFAGFLAIVSLAAAAVDWLGERTPGPSDVLAATLDPQGLMRSLPAESDVRIVNTWARGSVLHLHLADGTWKLPPVRWTLVLRAPRGLLLPACG